jgi:ABC-type polysaccharide/polyol phosphate transport system ATPase subunit
VSSTIAAPVDWVQAVGNLHFPRKADRRLQELMDRNNEGLLQESEREELEALVELSEQLSLVRGGALQILGKQPR